MEKNNVIRTFIQIRSDMGGKEDTLAPLVHEFTDERKKFISYQRIQPAGRFIHDQQFSSVRQGKSQCKLHFGTGGKGFYFLGWIQLEAGGQLLVFLFLPLGICAGNDLFHLGNGEAFIKGACSQNHADTIGQGPSVGTPASLGRSLSFGRRDRFAEQTDFPAVWFQQSENGTERGGFAGAVGTYKTGYAAFRNGEAGLGKRKVRVMFA